MFCLTITTQTMHDELSVRPITTVYVDGIPTVRIADQCDAVPLSSNLRSSKTFLIEIRDSMTFDQTVAYWTLLLGRQQTHASAIHLETERLLAA